MGMGKAHKQEFIYGSPYVIAWWEVLDNFMVFLRRTLWDGSKGVVYLGIEWPLLVCYGGQP